MNEIKLTAPELRKSVNSMLNFLEGFYPPHGSEELRAKFRGFLSEGFSEAVGDILHIARDAADAEEATYGKGLYLEEWQISAIKRIYGDDAMTVPVKFIGGKFVR